MTNRFLRWRVLPVAAGLLFALSASAQDAAGLATLQLPDAGAEALPAAEPAAPSVVTPAASDNLRAAPKRLADHGIPGMDVKVNLTSLEPMDVVQLIEFLAHRGALKNIVISGGVSGMAAKLKFDNVSVGDALEVVFSVNNLAYEVKGGIVTVMTDAEYQKLYGSSFYDHKQVRIVDLAFADPARVSAMLGAVKSAIGTVVADPVTGTLILIDTPEKIAEMQAVIAKADISTVARIVPAETRSFVLQYADVAEVEDDIRAMLTPEVGKLHTDQRTRTLIVTDLPHSLAKIGELVALFDKRPKQVFIEAKVVEVTLSDYYSLGINWNHLLEGVDPRFALTSVSKPLLTTVSPTLTRATDTERVTGGSLVYNTIASGGDLQVLLQALKQIGDTKILQNPHIAVRDGEEARIEVIEDQPYKEVTLESGTTNVTGVTYLFKKVGVQMSVTPRIGDDEMIAVDIAPEISTISEWYDGAPQEGTPVVKKSFAQTSIIVKNGVTIIIGGMIRNEKSTGVSKVPILGSIPLLGVLFRHTTDTTVSKETVVFLTPRTITGEEPHALLKDMKKPAKSMRTVGTSVENKAAKPVR